MLLECLIHSTNAQYLFSTYYVLDMILDTETRELSRHIPAYMELSGKTANTEETAETK